MTTEVDMLRKELHDHVLYCETRFSEGAAMHTKLLAEQQRCNEQLCELVKNTATVVEWSRNVEGAAKVYSGIQKIGAALVKIPLVGGALYAMYVGLVKLLNDLGT